MNKRASSNSDNAGKKQMKKTAIKVGQTHRTDRRNLAEPKLYDPRCAAAMKETIGSFCDVLGLGFSDSNWAEANYHRHAIANVADRLVYDEMGEMMRGAFTHPSHEELAAGKNRLFAHLDQRSATSFT